MSKEIHIDLRLRREQFELAVDIEIPGEGITAIFGPSGTGKTTLLRALAGLEQAAGRIEVAGETWQNQTLFLPPHKRSVGFVMQESSLFNHLSVRGNLEFGYKRSRATKRLIEFDDAVELLALDSLLGQHPTRLSGGERKRTAIGRALLSSPSLLLMDEPLASLDVHHRRELLPFLERLQHEVRIPVIYISHSPDEVARLADTLVLMDKGCVLASGSINDVLTSLDLPIAHDYDAGAVIQTTPGEYDAQYDLTPLQIDAGILWVPGHVPANVTARIRVLARDVSLTLEQQSGTSILNIVPATVVEMSASGGSSILIKLDAAGDTLLARVTRKSALALNLEPGKSLYAQIKTVALLGP